MFVLPPPLPSRFPCTHSPSRNHDEPPIFTCNATSSLTTNTSSIYSHIKPLHQNDLLPLQTRCYDFSPLLSFLSTHEPSDSLGPNELDLLWTYRAVSGPLWHSLLKSLCFSSSSSSSSISLAYSVVSWLQKHFSFQLLYAILIHTLGKSDQLYEAFLLSQRQPFSPLTYNAFISTCVHSNHLEKALHLISRMRLDGYPSDFVNYSLIIQSLV